MHKSSIALFAFLLFIGSTQSKPKTSIFWQITKPGSTDTSYLFGTLHLLEGSYVDTLPAVMKALSRANLVVGELAIDSSMKSEIAGLTQMDTSLTDLLSKRDYQFVDSAMHRLAGLSLHFFDHFQPMTVYAILLNGLYQKEHPENHHTGVPMDLYFQQSAKKHGARVRGLEEVKDETEALFDSMPVEEQVTEILDLLKHEKKSVKQLNEMLRVYAAGNIDKMMEIDEDESLSPKQLETLLYQRNKRWLTELPEMLDHHKTFIAVGAGHLSGDRGLVTGLRKKGYTMTPIDLRIAH